MNKTDVLNGDHLRDDHPMKMLKSGSGGGPLLTYMGVGGKFNRRPSGVGKAGGVGNGPSQAPMENKHSLFSRKPKAQHSIL